VAGREKNARGEGGGKKKEHKHTEKILKSLNKVVSQEIRKKKKRGARPCKRRGV